MPFAMKSGFNKQKRISIIIAATQKGSIGKDGKLPWNLPEDLKLFSHITRAVQDHSKVNAVVMGRKTFESLPAKCTPLPQRLNIIISTTMQAAGPTFTADQTLDVNVPIVVKSFADSLNFHHLVEKMFVIGGKRVYEEALKSEYLQTIFLTRVQSVKVDKESDVAINNLIDDRKFHPVSISKTYSNSNISYDFVRYEKIRKLRSESITSNSSHNVTATGLERELKDIEDFLNSLKPREEASPANENIHCCPHIVWRGHEEFQYLDLIARIIREGFQQEDRTGVGTLALFGETMRFDLSKTFPLLTTKEVFWRGVLEELLWFIKGDTNSNHLSEKRVQIWDANGSRSFLDSRGFHEREVGDLGPVYGFQWRHFGAHYKDMHTDYTGQGVDQLKNCIEILKTAPTDRRIILSAWNPSDLNKMALPPCHMFCQFLVSNKRKLSCVMYQRSADMGLGIPFNIASYSLMTRIVAQVCNLEVGEFIHVLGNAHVYLNHIQPLKKQLERYPRPFPILCIDSTIKNIDDFESHHFKLLGYSPMPKIQMTMAI